MDADFQRKGSGVSEIYVEFGGGLGDVFNRIYRDGSYRALELIPLHRRVNVGIISHNGHVDELFKWHPKRSQMEVHNYGYWLGDQDEAMRAKYGLPRPRGVPVPLVNGVPTPVKFYRSPDDPGYTPTHGSKGYVVLAHAGGQDDRTIPIPLARRLVDVARGRGFDVVQVGRNYTRMGRAPEICLVSKAEDMIDRLTVPGTADLLAGAAALITAHSSMNILAWHMRIPQVVAYPMSVLHRHFQKPDEWSFGSFDQQLSKITVHGEFSQEDNLAAGFNEMLGQIAS